jgi:choline dehydrogenase-like flavoprotein
MEAFDYVVVGSGFGGAIPALRLARAGRSVLVLEAGEPLTEKDFVQEWSFRAQARLFVTYTSKDFHVIFRYGRGLGGGSLTYAAAMLRSPTEVFDWRDRDGYRVWPASVTRAAMDPYYRMVEQEMDIVRASWADVPRAGGVFATMLDRMGLTADRSMYPIHDCLQCGFCMCGCPFGRKRHLNVNYIPRAQALGAEFRVRCRVDHIEPDGSGWKVAFLDPWGRESTVRGQRVILAASALETPGILLRSRPWMPDLHPQVGKNLNNNGDVAYIFQVPEDLAPTYPFMGRNNAGVITYAFWDEHRVTIHPGAGPPALVAAMDVYSEKDGPKVPLGLEFKRYVRDRYARYLFPALAIGLVDGEGEVTVTDAGVVEFDLPMTERLRAYIDRVAGIGRAIAEANGAELLRTGGETFEHGDAHPLSTVRIGDDADRAPCTPEGELRGHPGVFVTDGSSIPGGTGVNPAHTIAANAERIAAWLVAH